MVVKVTILPSISGPDVKSFTQPHTLRLAKNLSVLCTGFLLLFCAYKGLANLQSTMNLEEGVGVISLSVIYVGFMLSSLLLPKILISKMGCKWTLVLTSLAYCPYIAANAYPYFNAVIPTSFLNGLAAGPLWSAMSVYVNDMGYSYSVSINSEKDVITSFLFGIFFTVYGTTDIWGNLVSYYVLRPGNNTEDFAANASEPVLCGVDFLSTSVKQNHNFDPPSDDQRYLLVATYLSCGILASLVVALFLDKNSSDKEKSAKNESLLYQAWATLRHLKNADQILLLPITAFGGAERAYFLSEFSMAYVACSWGIYHVGYVFMCYGAVNAISSFVTGRLLKYVSRPSILSSACAMNVAAIATMFLWKPRPEEFRVLFILAAAWGFSDAIWHTHVFALYGHLFESEEAAYSNAQLWEAVGFLLICATSKYVYVRTKLCIILCLLSLGMFGYALIEIKNFRKK